MNYIQQNKIASMKGITVLMICLVLVASCSSDVLDKEPVTEVTAETISTEDRVVQAINAAYDPLQWKFEARSTETFQ